MAAASSLFGARSGLGKLASVPEASTSRGGLMLHGYARGSPCPTGTSGRTHLGLAASPTQHHCSGTCHNRHSTAKPARALVQEAITFIEGHSTPAGATAAATVATPGTAAHPHTHHTQHTQAGQTSTRPCYKPGDSASLEEAVPAIGSGLSGSRHDARQADMSLLPVTICQTIHLVPQITLVEAVEALKVAVTQELPRLSLYQSGVVRIEAQVPRGCTALRWLKGQCGSNSSSSVPRDNDCGTALAAAPSASRVYFSGRKSSAPDTAGAVAAESGIKGWSAVAGLGAAWLWHGAPGSGFGADIVRSMQRFLSHNQPRIKIIGGTRFDPQQEVADEWNSFGAYCFVLPLLEYMEDADGCVLACTLAWDIAPLSPSSQPDAASHPAAVSSNPGGLQHASVSGGGAATATAAAAAAQKALATIAPPATLSAHALQISRTELSHVPTSDDWHARIQQLLSALEFDATAAGADGFADVDAESGGTSNGVAAVRPLGALDIDLARQSYMADGQQGLDDLLTALNGSETLATGGAGAAAGDRAAGANAPAVSAAPGGSSLSKVVLARRSEFQLTGEADPLYVLEALQERDPRSYQLMLQPPGGTSTFVASTPERLYVRTGAHLASEAVAGTRPRGPPGDLEADFYLSLDLLHSAKDHAEFCCVRNWIRDALGPLCEGGQATVEVPKSVLKQGALQHLYGRLAGRLLPSCNDAHVLAALHPTPAVCGRPREQAMSYVADAEQFDRGFYAGPFGWISGSAAEFVVAIRSALICNAAVGSGGSVSKRSGSWVRTAPPALQQDLAVPAAKQVFLYAGVGVVKGSDSQSEWQELDLKIRQYQQLLQPSPPLASAPNLNAAWCRLLVEELCRQGTTMFCIAPGSRSSALALAVATHPRARLNIGIDERSLGFWALGFSRATGRPAVVITSSGTAVANLLPAVVEASLSHVPLLLLTADRPGELRDTGANQTIDQVKIFGGFTRWFQDVAPPQEDVPGRLVLTTADAALRHASGSGGGAGAGPGGPAGGASGPVHLNMQFREPLAPLFVPWDAQAFLKALGPWQIQQHPYSLPITAAAPSTPAHGTTPSPPRANSCPTPELHELSRLLRGARRGLLVVGELTSPCDTAAAGRLSHLLGWPMVADVLSGLRIGGTGRISAGGRPVHGASSADSKAGQPVAAGGPSLASLVIHHFDQLLLGDRRWWAELRPDVVLQLGTHLTSKRVAQFLEWSAEGQGAAAGVPWICVGPDADRHDAAHLVTHRATMTLAQLHDLAAEALQPDPGCTSHGSKGTTFAAEERAAPQRPWCQRQDKSVFLTTDSDEEASHVSNGSSSRSKSSAGAGSLRAAAAAARRGGGRKPHNSVATRTQKQQRQRPAPPPPPTLPPCSDYARLLLLLDAAVSDAVDAALDQLPTLSEPYVARHLARMLPCGHGLYLGNSMPIRDMDMYAVPRPTGGTDQQQGQPGDGSTSDKGDALHTGPSPTVATATVVGLGVAVGANRGASGIDGVLSTAAGFAEGLGRPTTLLIGDISFIHDSNGLGLLRGGEARAPLTILLVNNGGGSIFSFLPVASAVPPETFAPLWATPQSTDLECLCRAHGVPHQRVTRGTALGPALEAAWGLNRHSVVEVVTDRHTNVDLHRRIQAAALRAAQGAHALLTASSQAPGALPIVLQPRILTALSDIASNGTSASKEAAATAAGVVAAAVPVVPAALLPSLRIGSVSWRRYSLPLAAPLTTAAGVHAVQRDGLIVEVLVQTAGALPARGVASTSEAGAWRGAGEVTPLPGLHAEGLQDCEVQLGCLCEVLRGVTLPRTLPMLGGHMSRWWQEEAGVSADELLPSLRFGLETALLAALASTTGISLSALLCTHLPHPRFTLQQPLPWQLQSPYQTATPPAARQGPLPANPSSTGPARLSSPGGPAPRGEELSVSGLVDGHGSAAAAAAEAAALVAEGYWTLKVKVGRRCNPHDDAKVLLAIRAAVGVGVALRADANRRWTLEQAVQFAKAASGAALQFVEEPLADPAELLQFFQATGVVSAEQSSGAEAEASRGMPFALDESIDEGRLPLRSCTGRASALASSGRPCGGSKTAPEPLQPLASLCEAGSGLAAFVVKPTVLGSYEAVEEVAALAARCGVQVVVSSTFDSSLGVAQLAQLAAAIDQGLGHSQTLPGTPSGTASSSPPAPPYNPPCHGLGTLRWFARDIIEPPLGGVRGGTGCSGGPRIGLRAAQEVIDRVLQQGHDRRAAASLSASSSNGGSNGSSNGGSRAETSSSSNMSDTASRRSKANLMGLVSSNRGDQAASSLPSACDYSTADVTTPEGRYSFHLLKLAPLPPMAEAALDEPSALGATAISSGRTRASTLHAQAYVPACPVLFLHGFLGSSEDWRPIIHGLAAAGHRCMAIDLPGHGRTSVIEDNAQDEDSDDERADNDAGYSRPTYSVPAVTDAIAQLVCEQGLQGCVVVGYSLGARLALALATGHGHLFSAAALLSGTAGLTDTAAASARAAHDDALAAVLRRGSLASFITDWYNGPLWSSLRRHPRFSSLLADRLQQGAPTARRPAAATSGTAASSNEDMGQDYTRLAAEGLAEALSGMSTGRMAPLWEALPSCEVPLLLLCGGQDGKFVEVNQRMAQKLQGRAGGTEHSLQVVQGAGHALHQERPLVVLMHLRWLLTLVGEAGDSEVHLSSFGNGL